MTEIRTFALLKQLIVHNVCSESSANIFQGRSYNCIEADWQLYGSCSSAAQRPKGDAEGGGGHTMRATEICPRYAADSHGCLLRQIRAGWGNWAGSDAADGNLMASRQTLSLVPVRIGPFE